MLPLALLWIAVAIIGGSGCGLAGYALCQAIMTMWKGKKVAVLGARGVGKTTFMKFLTTGSIPEEYSPTQGIDKCEGRRFKLEDLNLIIKDSYDVTGDDCEGYELWQRELKTADIAFYLIRADLLMDGDSATEARAKKDLLHIKGWLEELDTKNIKRPSFFIIGTHCDFDSRYSSLDDKLVTEYRDKFQRLPFTNELVCMAGGRSQVDVILGSMKTSIFTEALVYMIFKRYAERSNK